MTYLNGHWFDEIKLEKCPIPICDRVGEGGAVDGLWWVGCSKCGLRTRNQGSRGEAVKAWNVRKQQDVGRYDPAPGHDVTVRIE